MEKIKHTFEESKNSMSDVRDFFEGLNISQLGRADLIRLDILKDMWANYYFEFDDATYCGNERPNKSIELFVMANSMEDTTVKALILDYTYDYIAGLSDEVFSFSESRDVNKMLNEVGLLNIADHYTTKKQIELSEGLNFLKRDKFSIEEYNKMLVALESAGILKKSNYNVVPYKMTLTINPANNGTEN